MENGFDLVNWGRYYGLYKNGNLLCVTVYKKGAAEVKRRVEELKMQLADAKKKKSTQKDERRDYECLGCRFLGGYRYRLFF